MNPNTGAERLLSDLIVMISPELKGITYNPNANRQSVKIQNRGLETFVYSHTKVVIIE